MKLKLLKDMFQKNYRIPSVKDYPFNQGKLIYIKPCHPSWNVSEKNPMIMQNNKFINRFWKCKNTKNKYFRIQMISVLKVLKF